MSLATLPTPVLEQHLVDTLAAIRRNSLRVEQLRAVLDARSDATLVVVARRRCGTDAGYQAHRRRGEVACRACRTAHAARTAQRRGEA